VISFIVTAYNRPLALRTCLSSLCQQIVSEWEAIVVDNSDNHVLAAEQEVLRVEIDKHSRVGYMYTRPDTAIGSNKSSHGYSLYKATEIGVENTRGDWLCFPNDDSYYCPWFAERMLRAAEKNSWDLVYCDIVMGGPKEHHVLEARPKLCCIDKTSFIMRREWFQGFSQGHGDSYPQADGLMIEDLVRRGIRHGRVPEVMCVHN